MSTGDRIDRLLREKGWSQAELARRIGVSTQSVWKLVSGQAQGSKYMHKIARELDTSPEYLTGESDDPAPVRLADRRLAWGAAPSEADDGVPVREIDLNFGMGASYLDVPVTEQVRRFPRTWLRQYTTSAPHQLFFAQGLGDSMMPTILDSDVLLIDSAQNHLSMADKIWAISYAGCGMVKRLRNVPDGGVAILSDNPAVPDTIAYDGELHLIGRVVAVVRKM